MRCEELQDTICLFPCIWSYACHALLCTGSPLAQPRYIKMTPSLMLWSNQHQRRLPHSQCRQVPITAEYLQLCRVSAACAVQHGRPHTKRCSSQAWVELGKGLHPPGPGSSTGGPTGRSSLHRARRAVLPGAIEA